MSPEHFGQYSGLHLVSNIRHADSLAHLMGFKHQFVQEPKWVWLHWSRFFCSMYEFFFFTGQWTLTLKTQTSLWVEPALPPAGCFHLNFCLKKPFTETWERLLVCGDSIKKWDTAHQRPHILSLTSVEDMADAPQKHLDHEKEQARSLLMCSFTKQPGVQRRPRGTSVCVCSQCGEWVCSFLTWANLSL